MATTVLITVVVTWFAAASFIPRRPDEALRVVVPR
jgi:hypothetical protein